ncbi:homeotic protein caudal isoform X2 [Phlebotomus argentipes]|uniref:homeotic protein caudal isoform X2 n=1 Tax=Phlebotomus argentipes TaxID=94469 RepID=UPI002893614E|nr:homeotic protein caudal isoform X2 [Phlebotomus argentipes]
MVSYYHNLAMYPKNPCSNLYPAPNHHWYAATNYHQPPNPQLFGSDPDPQAQQMYYTHHAMFHQSSPDWPSHDNFSPPQNSLLHQSTTSGSATPGLHLSHGPPGGMGQSGEHMSTDGLTNIPSPPITVSGSEMSSPGAANGAGSPHTASRPTPAKSPYEWMKKSSYQNQTNPGKTRTKDKYRVVYTDYQRLELEKEYHTSKYITIRRKTELAQALSLSERQVKIWFQNRRAKERKQTKKHESNPSAGQNHSSALGSIMETKPKIEPLHLQHHSALHQMSAMSMGMGPMSLHAHSLHHSPFGMTPPPPSTPGQHLHGPQVSQPAGSAGALI